MHGCPLCLGPYLRGRHVSKIWKHVLPYDPSNYRYVIFMWAKCLHRETAWQTKFARLAYKLVDRFGSSDLTWCVYKAETRWGSGGRQGHRHRRRRLHLHGSQRKQRRLCVGLRHSGQRTQAGTLLQASSDPSSPIRKEWVQPRRVPRQDLLWSKQVWALIQFSSVFLKNNNN